MFACGPYQDRTALERLSASWSNSMDTRPALSFVHQRVIAMASVEADRRTGCGPSVDSYPAGTLRVVEGMASLDHARCRECGLCIRACPTCTLFRMREETPSQGMDPRRLIGEQRMMRPPRAWSGQDTEPRRWTRRGLPVGRRAGMSQVTPAAPASPGGSFDRQVGELKDILGDLQGDLTELLERLDRFAR